MKTNFVLLALELEGTPAEVRRKVTALHMYADEMGFKPTSINRVMNVHKDSAYDFTETVDETLKRVSEGREEE